MRTVYMEWELEEAEEGSPGGVGFGEAETFQNDLSHNLY